MVVGEGRECLSVREKRRVVASWADEGRPSWIDVGEKKMGFEHNTHWDSSLSCFLLLHNFFLCCLKGWFEV